MKASKFSDAYKSFILKQATDGVPVADICRKAGISQATFFNWKKKYDGLLPPEMRRLKLLEDKNAEAVIRALPKWFAHYNELLPHRALGYRSPREVISSRLNQSTGRTCPEIKGRQQSGRRSAPCLTRFKPR